MTSVRRTLLVTMLAAIAVVTLVAGFAVQRLARQEVDAILDYHLRQLALSLAEQGRGAVAVGDDEALDFVIQIWAPDGERLFTSRPGAGLPDVAALGFGTVRTRTGAWRVYAAELRGLVVEVAQPLRVRDALAVRAATRTLAPVVLMLPLLALLVWRSVGRALAPLEIGRAHV